MKRNRQKNIASLLLCILSLAACKKDAEVDPPGAITYTMFYNGSIDFYNSTGLLLVNNSDTQQLTYNGLSNQPLGAFNYGNYQKMRPGSYLISFTDSAAKPVKLTNDVYTLEASRYQTIYLTDSAGYYQTLLSNDEVERHTDSASIRIIHLSQDAGPVTLYIDTLKITNTEHITFRNISRFIRVKPDLKPGIRVRYEKNGEELTLTRKSFALEAGKCYTLILRGAVNPPDGNVNKSINLSGIINK